MFISEVLEEHILVILRILKLFCSYFIFGVYWIILKVPRIFDHFKNFKGIFYFVHVPICGNIFSKKKKVVKTIWYRDFKVTLVILFRGVWYGQCEGRN